MIEGMNVAGTTYLYSLMWSKKLNVLMVVVQSSLKNRILTTFRTLNMFSFPTQRRFPLPAALLDIECY